MIFKLMKYKLLILAVIVNLLTTGCSKHHLISDREYRKTVQTSFKEKFKLASNRKEVLFDILKNDLSIQQKEAVEFLFAFMPLSDLADYGGDFFLANANIALSARKEMPWGKYIPEDIFLHYVLPCRVNNENLDSFRIVYHKEIADRIKGLGLKDAALEINHWCHEKVSYHPSDIRTSGPMSTILSSRGRCGEESTFTVSALRAAGIPARQVYCPRWAHADDNHAWVEVWVDGKWFYMGACEPEPVFDRGWFTEPSRRAMLIHTKSFGARYGNENVVYSTPNYSEINNLSKYAITKRLFVKVTDSLGLPVKNALVEFQLYNYSEFYPLTIVPTNKIGISSLETGIGDLLIWARKGDNFNYRKTAVAESDSVLIRLDRKAKGSSSDDLDLNVPLAAVPLQGPSPEMMKRNAERLAAEDLVRLSYIGSWIKPAEARSFALEMNTDTAETGKIISKSMGNYKAIMSFIRHTPQVQRERALSMLGIISEKDLRDTKAVILSDHLDNIQNPYGLDPKGDVFINYVLNPRVANEKLTDWRGWLRKNLPTDVVSGAAGDLALIKKFIDETISVADSENYYSTPLTPEGVGELKVSDMQSRAIYFVAVCRTLGIPARLEPSNGIPQYFFKSSWNYVRFADEKKLPKERAYVRLMSDDKDPVPEYYINFTLARFENGRYNTLEYEYNKPVTTFRDELELIPGHYMLVTGNRLNDNKILAGISFFDLPPDQHIKLPIQLRK
jgi:transglutaminase-like putative cysteine protease